MSEFKQYLRTNVAEMRPYVKGEDLTNISIAKVDKPEEDMGMVARNPENHEDQCYVAREYFENNFVDLLDMDVQVEPVGGKTFGNCDSSGTRDNVRDVQFWGDGDTFKLISKAWSQSEGWMKSTKAMEIHNSGCLVQVTTQQGDNVAEAIEFIPNVKIQEIEKNGKVISRKLVKR